MHKLYYSTYNVQERDFEYATQFILNSYLLNTIFSECTASIFIRKLGYVKLGKNTALQSFQFQLPLHLRYLGSDTSNQNSIHRTLNMFVIQLLERLRQENKGGIGSAMPEGIALS